MANANVLSTATAAPVLLRAEARLAEREQVWASLVAAGLAWQPEPIKPAGEDNVLTLSSPAEWTAEHRKDAALHVLGVEAALRQFGWTLGSVAASWVQFVRCRPVWISQTVLRPRKDERWAAQDAFCAGLVEPLLEQCREEAQDRWWQRWSTPLRRMRAAVGRRRTGDSLAELQAMVESLTPRRRWSPWQTCSRALEPAGPAAILAKEEASRRGARFIYEWRGGKPASAPLRPWPGVAWVRFHESAEEAAADYLDQRALHACALPLWNRTGDPMESCPQRAQADLLIAAGRGNVPESGEELARFARVIQRMAPAALVEYCGAQAPRGWDQFLDAMRSAYRVARVTETGPGKRLCLLERD